jgi:hypothetical protein
MERVFPSLPIRVCGSLVITVITGRTLPTNGWHRTDNPYFIKMNIRHKSALDLEQNPAIIHFSEIRP